MSSSRLSRQILKHEICASMTLYLTLYLTLTYTSPSILQDQICASVISDLLPHLTLTYDSPYLIYLTSSNCPCRVIVIAVSKCLRRYWKLSGGTNLFTSASSCQRGCPKNYVQGGNYGFRFYDEDVVATWYAYTSAKRHQGYVLT